MSEGRAIDEEVLKGLDVIQFFTRLQVWEDDIERKIQQLKK